MAAVLTALGVPAAAADRWAALRGVSTASASVAVSVDVMDGVAATAKGVRSRLAGDAGKLLVIGVQSVEGSGGGGYLNLDARQEVR